MIYCKLSASKAMRVARSGAMAWQPGQGDLLACATPTGGKILNMEHPEAEAVQLGTDSTIYVAWSPAGDLLVTLGERNVVWNSHGARVATLLGKTGGVEAKFNRSGSLVAVVHQNWSCDVFNTVTGVLRQSVKCNRHFIYNDTTPIVWKDDHEFFCRDVEVGKINHWRLGQVEPFQIIIGQYSLITTLAFNPEKGILASGGYNGTIRLWSEGGLTELNGHSRAVLGLLWNSNHSGIITSFSLDHQVRIWDAISKTTLHIYEGFNFLFNPTYRPMIPLSFSSDGHFFAAACHGNVKVVKVSTGETVVQCEESVMGVSWSRGSNKLAVETMKVYNLENVLGINLKAMAMKCVAGLLQKNLTNVKDEAEKFLGEKIPAKLVPDVLMYLN